MIALYNWVDFIPNLVLDFRVRGQEINSLVESNDHSVVTREIIDEDIAIYFVLDETSNRGAFPVRVLLQCSYQRIDDVFSLRFLLRNELLFFIDHFDHVEFESIVA